MKLDRIFRGILLKFSNILVVSTDYIVLISISPMLKAGNLQSIASSAIVPNLFKHYFKGGQYGGFFLYCKKIPLIFLCWNCQ